MELFFSLFLALFAASSSLAQDGGGVAGAPVGGRPNASPEASIAPGELRFAFPAGESRGTMLGSAVAGRPAVFLVPVPARTALTIGVQSKTNEARFSIYEAGSEAPLAGTRPEDGAVRWIGQSNRGGDLRVVVHTRGAETPVRLEVSIDRHLDFEGTRGE
jgi:hypothetical protein